MKYEVGDRVRIKSLDWYNENKDEYGNIDINYDFTFYADRSRYCGKIFTISEVFDNCYTVKEDNNEYYWTDEMIEHLVAARGEGTRSYAFGPTSQTTPSSELWKKSVEKETPKFKIDDIVFVKNIGWVRITNSYWDSLDNEYLYETIEINGEGEYDSINQSDIECQMLPESENPHTCGNKITLDEYKNNDKEWLFNKLAMLDNITALESIQDIFNHLQQSKYPKTYEECYKIMGVKLSDCYIQGYKSPLLEDLQELIICRDAYWKIAGEEMGLSKPWEPDFASCKIKYAITYYNNVVSRYSEVDYNSAILVFPTEEMRDAFYENFKELIEGCKELL